MKYDKEYYLRVWEIAPLNGTKGFTVEKHYIRTTSADNIKRRYVLYRGETDLSDKEVFDLLMGEMKEGLEPAVSKTINRIRKEISEFIKNCS